MLGRHKDSGRRTAGGLSLLLLLFLLQLVMAVPASAAPSLTLSPEYGEPTSVVRVSGAGYLPTGGQPQLVDLCWDRADCADLGIAGVGALGEFSRNLIIPDVAPGSYRIYACQGSDCASSEFEVLGAAPPPTTTSTAVTTTVPASSTSTRPASTPTSTQVTTTTAAGTTPDPSQITTSSTQPGSSPIGGAGGIPPPSSPADEVAVVSMTSGVGAATQPQTLSVMPSFGVQPGSNGVANSGGQPAVSALGPVEGSPETPTAAGVAVGESPNGFWSLQTPAVVWVVWLGVVLASGLMISLFVWIGGKMRTKPM